MVRRLQLLEYLDERLGKHRGRGPEYSFFCPVCIDRLGSESSKRKLGINLAKGVGGCFRCGYGFRSWERLFRTINGGRLRAEEIQLLAHEVELPKTGTLRDAVSRTVRPSLSVGAHRLRNVPLPSEYRRLEDIPKHERKGIRYRPAFRYLFEQRGATWDDVRRFQIGYCPLGEFARYLIFPVVQNGSIVYFTSRYVTDDPPNDMKTKNPENREGFHQRGTCLLNYDACRGQKVIAMIEGAFDCMAYPFALGVLGKFLTEAQADLIAALVPFGLEEVMVSLDPHTGVQADAAISALLPRVPRVSQVPLGSGDPWEVRGDLEALTASRREPGVLDRVSQRIRGT